MSTTYPAYLAAPQAPKARYKGCRKNLFDLGRAAAVENQGTNQRMAIA